MIMDTPPRRICVSGPGAPAVAETLRVRLRELDSEADLRFDVQANSISEAALCFEVSEYDAPDFATEKILDALADEGLVVFDDGELTEEEEEQIRARLQGLGYLE